MKGYKAFNKDLQCQGYQFEVGVWHEHPGPIELCKSGFHFCKWPSGPWSYYSDEGTRIFEVEAENVLNIKEEPGADFKLVAAKIKLLKEITPGGDSNTGNRNTGDRNTGHSNTGNWNTGDWNTGHRNTGHSNTGNWNTGDWNATNYSSGFFCQLEPTVLSFDIQTDFSRKEFIERFPEVYNLSELLMKDEPINFHDYKNIPGITKEKLKTLHQKFIKGRKKNV